MFRVLKYRHLTATPGAPPLRRSTSLSSRTHTFAEFLRLTLKYESVRGRFCERRVV